MFVFYCQFVRCVIFFLEKNSFKHLKLALCFVRIFTFVAYLFFMTFKYVFVRSFVHSIPLFAFILFGEKNRSNTYARTHTCDTFIPTCVCVCVCLCVWRATLNTKKKKKGTRKKATARTKRNYSVLVFQANFCFASCSQNTFGKWQSHFRHNDQFACVDAQVKAKPKNKTKAFINTNKFLINI